MQICNGTEAAALKRQILKEDYPKNLVMAVIDDYDLELPEFTPDVVAGINYAVSTLDEREQMILYLRYVEKKTLKEIGEHFGFKQERSRQIEVRALRKLRTPVNHSDEHCSSDGPAKCRRARAEVSGDCVKNGARNLIVLCSYVCFARFSHT